MAKRKAQPEPGARRAIERIDKFEAAARLGISVRQIRRLAAENRDMPVIGRGATRRFLWPALREWRDRKLVEQGANSVRSEAYEAGRARKVAAEASMVELDLAQRRGVLMPSALYAQELEAAYQRVRAHQLNAPARYAPQLLAAFPDRLRTDDIIRAEEFLRGMMGDQAAELAAGDDVPDDEEQDR